MSESTIQIVKLKRVDKIHNNISDYCHPLSLLEFIEENRETHFLLRIETQIYFFQKEIIDFEVDDCNYMISGMEEDADHIIFLSYYDGATYADELIEESLMKYYNEK